jgi:PPOX class probable F420-dependent enzyme
MLTFTPEQQKFFARDTRAMAYLALVLSDGSPQVTPLWFDWDGTHIIINTARGRVKDNILKKHPTVSLCITANDPYKYLQIRGKVVDETEQGAFDVICDLNEKYHGDRNFTKRPGQIRVTYKILPEKLDSHL